MKFLNRYQTAVQTTTMINGWAEKFAAQLTSSIVRDNWPNTN